MLDSKTVFSIFIAAVSGTGCAAPEDAPRHAQASPAQVTGSKVRIQTSGSAGPIDASGDSLRLSSRQTEMILDGNVSVAIADLSGLALEGDTLFLDLEKGTLKLEGNVVSTFSTDVTEPLP